MQLTESFVGLALMGLASGQLVELSNCPIPGPAYPPLKDLGSSKIIQDIQESFAKLMKDAVATGETEWGQIGTANTSFSIGVFSADSDDFLFEYHHHGTELDGSLTGGLEPSYWSEPVSKFFPELTEAPTGSQVHYVQWSEVTLGALASHMGGLARTNAFDDISGIPGIENIGLPRLSDSNVTKCALPGMSPCTREEAIRLILQQDPATAAWHTPVYSNEAFQILGWAYESITGETLEDAFNSAIVEPLGLSRTFWSPPKNDSNANVVNLESSLSSPVLAYEFEEDMGSYKPTGGVYASLGDLSTIGRSILRSSLLPHSVTREWFQPVTLTASTHTAVGKAWEISRMDVPIHPGSDRTRLVDLYGKSGGISAYLTYLILSPDHGIGFTINVASKGAFGGGLQVDPTMLSLTDLLLDKWVPAAEAAAREATGERFAGTYAADDGTDSVIELALVPGRMGLTVQRLIYNGTDFFPSVGGTRGFQGADLQFVGLADEGEVTFRAVFSAPVPKGSGRESHMSKRCSGIWSGHGWFIYGNVGLDEVVFSVDENGKGTVVTVPALRTRFVKQSDAEAVDDGGSQVSFDEL